MWAPRRAEHNFQFYQIKRVFLACPGDLMAERSRFTRLLETVNNLRAHSLGFHLHPVGWERVIPSFGRPQSLINVELHTADLVVVMFWNRIGSPSSAKSDKTATVEEFEEALGAFERTGRPLVWVYFRKPSSEPDAQLQGVLNFRRELESGKQIFFREYDSIADWEEMFREHLVAYLDGLKRWNIDSNFQNANPDNALFLGRFYGEGVSQGGAALELRADLDGDDHDEIIHFWYSHGGYSLAVKKYDESFNLALPPSISENAVHFHLAIKDVTNDGLPEILLAFTNGPATLNVAIWGFNEEGRRTRDFTSSSFHMLQELEGQYQARVLEGGTIILPYGSAGFRFVCRWDGSHFTKSDE